VAAAQGFPLFEIAQLGYYLDDQKMGAFEVGAPTDHVRLLTGREPEGFETILSRHVDTDPMAVTNARNQARMMRILIRAALTRLPDLPAWEEEQGHPTLKLPLLATDSEEWVRSASDERLNLVSAADPKFPTRVQA